ncbi:MAG: hypothetical protein F7C34_03385 [Desulfurococcales archaeon]|nr:hypothetical protein [Desulfurococcales archaeon]
MGRASRRGIVHIIDVLIALGVIAAVVMAGVSVIVAKLNTRPQSMPDPTGLDRYISERLGSGDWIPLVAEGRSSEIRAEIESLYQGSPRPVYVAVYIYAINPSLGTIGVVDSSDPGLYSSYAVLRYFVPVGGYYGDVSYVLEVRVYW